MILLFNITKIIKSNFTQSIIIYSGIHIVQVDYRIYSNLWGSLMTIMTGH